MDGEPANKILQGFHPGVGGDWYQAVPETPSVAYTAADDLWTRCSPALQAFLRALSDSDQHRAGGDLALGALGHGVTLWDSFPDAPRWPHADEGYSYYIGDDGGVYVDGGLCEGARHAKVWTLTPDGLYR